MVELDFQAGTARGLSRGARDAVRRTGRLPAGLVHPAVEQAWAAVNAAKAFEGKSATVADIQRARDEGWQVGQRSGWGAFGVKMSAPMPNDPECDCGWSAPVGAGDGCGEKVTDEHAEQEESKRTSETFYTGSVSGAGRWVYKNSKCEFEYSCDAPCGCYEKGGDQELVGVRSGVSSHCPDGSAAPCPDVDYHVVYDSGKGKCLAYAQCMKEDVPCGEPGKGWFPWGEMAPCPKAATSSMSTGTRDACGGASGHAEDVSPATVGDARSIVEAGLWHDDDMRATTPLGALLGMGGCAGCSVKTDPGAWDCALEKQADKYAAILPRTCGCAFYLDYNDPRLGTRLYKFCADLFPPMLGDTYAYLHTLCMANILECVFKQPDRTKEQLEKYCPCPDFSPPGPADLPDFSA